MWIGASLRDRALLAACGGSVAEAVRRDLGHLQAFGLRPIGELTVTVVHESDWAEAWNKRATLLYLQGRDDESVAAIGRVLEIEPRHFGALSGMGLILQEIGDDKHALEVYRRALDVYPRLQRIPDVVKTLQEKVEGRDI